MNYWNEVGPILKACAKDNQESSKKLTQLFFLWHKDQLSGLKNERIREKAEQLFDKSPLIIAIYAPTESGWKAGESVYFISTNPVKLVDRILWK